ncbi:zinc finger protein, putative [Ixodes scapularis]|uniref:Zinc finger protein, putative n=1 Tax=Ixodes scapularis TaxID=6945 RepID=B7PX63_IXOSC|nr:zinc finger protein, putative [Ixodes scapularis]|eukprot:XP_002410533.1 zinc finger protein, putative [Ixodes scapularis]
MGKPKPPPKAPQLHYCEVCKISCAGPQTYKEHLEGQKHKKKEAALKSNGAAGAPPLPRGGTALRCELCDVTCTGSDAYAAHIRGAKHQKVVKLHTKLGKPIPSTEPVVIAPPSGTTTAKAGATAATTTTTAAAAAGVAAGGGGDAKVADGEAGSQGSEEGAGDSLDKGVEVQPVGQDYIEEMRNDEGKVISFQCKLCECRFNDPNAKEMHMKGRRHRLQYKVGMAAGHLGLGGGGPGSGAAHGHQHGEGPQDGVGCPGRRVSSLDSGVASCWPRRVPLRSSVLKEPWQPAALGCFASIGQCVWCRSLTPPATLLLAVWSPRLRRLQPPLRQQPRQHQQRMARRWRPILCGRVGFSPTSPLNRKEEAPQQQRLLKGVMRVGVLAKGLLLAGDLTVGLVVMCSEKPGRTLLARVAALLPKHLAAVAPDDKYEVRASPQDAAVLLTSTGEPKVTVWVTLTSPVMRDTAPTDASNASAKDPPDVLGRQKCLDALAALRHAKWFQARASSLQSCVMVIRILRDLCQRVPTWSTLNAWALELLVEKVLSSAGQPMPPGDALRRVLEAVAGGILLPGDPGLVDPCEREPVDALAGLTDQAREDITASAQHALRLVAFRQIHKVLGMDPLPPPKFARNLMNRKRRRDGEANEAEGADGKKDKKEEQAKVAEPAAKA